MLSVLKICLEFWKHAWTNCRSFAAYCESIRCIFNVCTLVTVKLTRQNHGGRWWLTNRTLPGIIASFSNKAALPTWNFEYGEWLNSFIIKSNYFNKLKLYLRNFPSCQLIILDFNSIWRIFESRIGVSFRSKGSITVCTR